MAHFHFIYLWFKTLHFAQLNFNLLSIRYPPHPQMLEKHHFIKNQKHNIDQKYKPLNLFLTSPRNMKIPCIELGF